MRNLLKYARKYLPYLLLAPLCIMGEVLLEVYIPRVMTALVDVGIPSRDLDTVMHYGWIMVGMSVLSLAAGCAATYFSSKGGIGFGSELRKAVFDKIQDFSFANIDSFRQSSLITRLTTDVEFVQQGMMMATRIFVRAPFMMVMAIIMALQINPTLVRVFYIAIPLIILVVVIVAKAALPLFRKMMKQYDGLNQRVQEDLTGIRVVKAYVREGYEKQRFGATNRDLMNSSIRVELLMSVMSPVMGLAIYGCTAAILWYGGNLIISEAMTTGELISFISYVMQILMGLIMIAMIFLFMVELRGSVGRINEVLATRSDITDGSYDQAPADGSVEFRHVDFAYSAQAREPVLKDVSFSIAAGQTIGVIGATGCGKTTLVSLIPRLYDAVSGEVLVGGRNVKEYRLKPLRDSVALVLQQNVLFSGTIRDNLKWGDEQADDEAIRDACRKAQADEFIMAFPQGYGTVLGQGGVNLSGGQKQRLCIARAILKKPQIVILDDSTSAVDTATDALIHQALRQELSGTTTIVIAQRIASVLDADKVLILDDGAVAAYDTPQNLLKDNAVFREIYHTQLKGVAADA
jgi:ATP-binding cassette subfamily B protein